MKKLSLLLFASGVLFTAGCGEYAAGLALGRCSLSLPTACAGSCVDLKSDAKNCGACGTTCGKGLVCAEGACVCPPGQTACDGKCVDTQTDPSHCGACGTQCLVELPVCGNGQCLEFCPPPSSQCNKSCYNLATDPANCGFCGKVCPAGNICSEGHCVAQVMPDLGDGPDGGTISPAADLAIETPDLSTADLVVIPDLAKADIVVKPDMACTAGIYNQFCGGASTCRCPKGTRCKATPDCEQGLTCKAGMNFDFECQ